MRECIEMKGADGNLCWWETIIHSYKLDWLMCCKFSIVMCCKAITFKYMLYGSKLVVEDLRFNVRVLFLPYLVRVD